MKKVLCFLILGFSLVFAETERYIVIHEGSNKTYKKLSEIDSMTFVDSTVTGGWITFYSKRFLAAAIDMISDNVSLTSLYDSEGNHLGIQVGDTITISATSGTGGVGQQAVNLTVVNTALEANGDPLKIYSYYDLMVEIHNIISGINPTVTTTLVQAGTSAGAIAIDNTGGGATPANDIVYLQIIINRQESSFYFSKAFSFPTTIAAITGTAVSDFLRRLAKSTDDIDDLYDASGNEIGKTTGLEDGAIIAINGALKGITVSTGTIAYSQTSTNLQNIIDEIRFTFGFSQFDTVNINSAGTDDSIPDGTIVIKSQNLTNVSVQASDPNTGNSATPNRFNDNMAFEKL